MPDTEPLEPRESLILALANAVAASIGQMTLIENDANIESGLLGKYEPKDTDVLQIRVYPGSPEVRRISRSQDEWDISIYVSCMRSVKGFSESVLLGQMESIMEWFVGRTLQVNGKRYRAQVSELPQDLNRDLLNEKKIFESTVAIRFRALV